ncbi:MAG: hypothetical protein IKN26_07885, partial [Eubacterium sp.]|nr:hypothetical protein [Eubacterium sp.]
IVFRIDIDSKIQINEVETSIENPLEEKDFRLIEKEFEKKIEKICAACVKKCFDMKSDPFMSARYLYFKDKDAYYSLKDSHRENLENISVSLNASASLKRIKNNTSNRY